MRASITIGRNSKGKFGDNDIKGVTVLNGDKGWRKFGDKDMEMDGDAGHQREANDLSRRSSRH